MNKVKGIVKWYSPIKGIGFITSDSIPGDIFFHYSAVAKELQQEELNGSHVIFNLITGPKGPQAFDVTIQG